MTLGKLGHIARIQFLHSFVIILLLASGVNTYAQKEQYPILLKSGKITPSKDLSYFKRHKNDYEKYKFKDQYLVLIQFSDVPGAFNEKTIEDHQITLLAYIPYHSFLATIPSNISIKKLKELNVLFIEFPEGLSKVSQKLDVSTPANARLSSDSIELKIWYYDSYSKNDIIEVLDHLGTVLKSKTDNDNTLLIKTTRENIQLIAKKPFISHIAPLTSPQTTFKTQNDNVLSNSRSSYISALSGKNLNGENIVIGVGDDGNVEHVDIKGRVTNTGNLPTDGHANHITGIIAGAGNIDPLHRGIAPLASIRTDDYTEIWKNTSANYNEYNMVITNNSYAELGQNCSAYGEYGAVSANIDDISNTNPQTIHVFSSSNIFNSNPIPTCPPYPHLYGTVANEYVCAKNVLTVGAVNERDIIYGTLTNDFFSSARGPTQDGRIKPEICGIGVDVHSFSLDNDYEDRTGTSQACANITGVLAQMYQRYNQIYEKNPNASLMKALVCNTAYDLGNLGPDYIFGFGRVNALRAVEALEDTAFFENTIQKDTEQQHSITIPNDMASLKIMLYWHDFRGALPSLISLVDDLDLEVIGPDGTTYLPWVLDPTPGLVTNSAVKKRDSLNNIEQVTISKPLGGEYTIKVSGDHMQYTNASYAVTYDVVSQDVRFIYPNDKEKISPGESPILYWDVAKNNTSSFKLEFTEDGNNWVTLADNIPSGQRYYDAWVAPDIVSNVCKFRITAKATGSSDITDHAFSIIPIPTGLTITPECDSVLTFSWNPVPENGPNYYNVYQMNNKYMELISVTDNTQIQIGGLEIGRTYWFSVGTESSFNGAESRRAKAISYLHNSVGGTCPTNPSIQPNVLFFQNEILENKNIGDNVGFFYPESGLEYFLIPGLESNDNNSFFIDEVNELKASKTFNYEEQSIYKIRYRASNKLISPPMFKTGTFTITIGDENDPPSIFNPISPSHGIEVNNLKNTFLWQESVDEDFNSSPVQYMLIISGPSVQDTIYTTNNTHEYLNTSLQLGSEYQWHVLATDGIDTTSTLNSHTFSIPDVLPETFDLSSPQNNITLDNYEHTYSWLLAFGNGKNITYDLVITDAAIGSASSNDTIITDIDSTAILFNGEDFYQPGYSYRWYVIAHNSTETEQSKNTFTLYTQPVHVEEELKIRESVSLSPNPFKHSFDISIALPNPGKLKIGLSDLFGNPVYSKELNQSLVEQMNINIEPPASISPGIYVCQVLFDDKIIYATKLIKVQ